MSPLIVVENERKCEGVFAKRELVTPDLVKYKYGPAFREVQLSEKVCRTRVGEKPAGGAYHIRTAEYGKTFAFAQTEINRINAQA